MENETCLNGSQFLRNIIFNLHNMKDICLILCSHSIYYKKIAVINSFFLSS